MRLYKSGLLVAAILAVAAAAGCNKQSETAAETAATGEKTGGGVHSGAAAVKHVAKPHAAPAAVTLPEGTPLPVRTTSTLSTKTQEAGQAFTAHLVEPLVHQGHEIAPRGTEVEGQIVDADKGGRVKGRATIAVQLTSLRLANGRTIEIQTNTIAREAPATKKKDAAKIGIGSGVGAAIGAIAGGGRGAAIGAAAGAGAGTGAVLATRGDPAVIPAESVLQFELRAPVTIR